jgi:hypothetical protein
MPIPIGNSLQSRRDRWKKFSQVVRLLWESEQIPGYMHWCLVGWDDIDRMTALHTRWDGTSTLWEDAWTMDDTTKELYDEWHKAGRRIVLWLFCAVTLSMAIEEYNPGKVRRSNNNRFWIYGPSPSQDRREKLELYRRGALTSWLIE